MHIATIITDALMVLKETGSIDKDALKEYAVKNADQLSEEEIAILVGLLGWRANLEEFARESPLAATAYIRIMAGTVSITRCPPGRPASHRTLACDPARVLGTPLAKVAIQLGDAEKSAQEDIESILDEIINHVVAPRAPKRVTNAFGRLVWPRPYYAGRISKDIRPGMSPRYMELVKDHEFYTARVRSM
jgi:hypothetical protein